jgi:hypothetical protein
MSLPDEPDVDLERAKTKNCSSHIQSFEVRRRRLKKRMRSNRIKDIDPYGSNPGESYHEYCLRIKGLNTKTCFAMPSFLKNADLEGDTVMTEPPSPLSSEFGGHVESNAGLALINSCCESFIEDIDW